MSRRAARTRHPLQSLFLFAVICAIGYFGWQNRHLITGSAKQHLTSQERSQIRQMILDEFGDHPDFMTVRAISWRPHEQRYRLDVELDDSCMTARSICHEIAAFVAAESEMKATVIGVDSTGRELGRAVT